MLIISDECRTVAGVLDQNLEWHPSMTAGEICQFPLLHKGIRYTACPKSQRGYWCVTKKGRQLYTSGTDFGYCSDNCSKATDIGKQLTNFQHLQNL